MNLFYNHCLQIPKEQAVRILTELFGQSVQIC